MIRKVFYIKAGFTFYIVNHFFSHIPSYSIRHWAYKKILKIKLGKDSSIHINSFVTGNNIVIGDYSTIGRRTYLDGRGGLKIGNCVSISPDVQLITASHDKDDPDFKNVLLPVIIEDYVWIGTRAIILPGVTLGFGCVVAAGAVVTKSIPPFAVAAGVPAKVKLGMRNKCFKYKPVYFFPFD